MKNVPNSGAALFEGHGSVPPPALPPVVETCGSMPFSPAVKSPVVRVLESWLASSEDARFSVGGIHQLRETIKRYPPKTVSKQVQENFCGSDIEEIRRAFVAAGLTKEKEKKVNVLMESQSSPDTAETLLREAVIHIPGCDSVLRDRIESFLSR